LALRDRSARQADQAARRPEVRAAFNSPFWLAPLLLELLADGRWNVQAPGFVLRDDGEAFVLGGVCGDCVSETIRRHFRAFQKAFGWPAERSVAAAGLVTPERSLGQA
jgi:hypothetical protein